MVIVFSPRRSPGILYFSKNTFMKNLWSKLDDYIHSIYFAKDYRNYYERGGNIFYILNIPLLLLWWIIRHLFKADKQGEN